MPFTAYTATLSQFHSDAIDNKIADKIRDAFKEKGFGVKDNEYNSWQRSLTLVANQLNDDDRLRDDVGIACEMAPGRGRRSIDLVISGHDELGSPNIVVVELKQWSKIEFSEVGDTFVYANVGGRKWDDKQHPALQAQGYNKLLKDYNDYVEKSGIVINSCAYLHNMNSSKKIKDRRFSKHFDIGTVFIKSDREKLLNFICGFISKGDRCEILDGISNSIIRPSLQLAENVGEIMKGRQIYMPVEEQQKAINTILRASIDGVSVAHLNTNRKKSFFKRIYDKLCNQTSPKKHVIIIEGGPGSGKSVIAINVLAELIQKQKNALYCTPNIPLKDNIRINFDKENSNNFNDCFQGPNGFTNGRANEFEVLIIDEAQRLSEKFSLNANKLFSPEKAIETSLCTVFFVDERQMTCFKDIGDVKRITEAANQANASVQRFNLQSRFRCNGSLEYEQWLGNILGYGDEKIPFSSVDFDFKVMDSATELSQEIEKLYYKGEIARLTASYCWEFNSRADPEEIDFILDDGDFEAQWNTDFSGTDKQTWLTHDGVERIGWVNEIQGNEVAYVGVIIGPDITYNSEKEILEINYDMHNNKSAAKKGVGMAIKRKEKGAVERCEGAIRNSYWVLLSRATKGCFVYSEDPEVRDYLKRMCNQ
jgi:DUF2075 family protein